ncbi:TfoX/Sxy family protein [Chlamydiota bacterium]
MAISDEFLNYVLEQLEVVGLIDHKKMFGGVGIYYDGLFFAIIANDILYFKVDDSNKEDYTKNNMGPFKPYGEKSYSMQYFEVPIDVLEDTEQLYLWANKAISVAKRSRKNYNDN